MTTRDREVGRPPTVNQRWHAVSVKPGPGACPVASAVTERRWLSKDAPMLPLPGCTRPDACRCTYGHHDDRRLGPRRTDETDAFRMPAQVSGDRRTQKSRRK